jgi:hypothetical protein
MIDFTEIARINLISGAGGGDPKAGLCIMEMVSYFDGADRVTDRPECACPTLTEFAIRLNDGALSQDDRDTLKPLLPLLAGTRSDEHRRARVEHIVRAVTHRIVAPVFDLSDPPQHAAALRAAHAMVEIKEAAQKARADAAAADAAYAAYAASAAADAAYAAYAASASAADADAARRWVWFVRREILIEAIKLGLHGGLDVETYAKRAADLRAVLEGADNDA